VLKRRSVSDPANVPEAIVLALQAGREVNHNFELNFRAYHRQVAGYFERQGIGHEQSRDLTQEVFLVVLGNASTLRDPASFRSWLFGIARNKMLHYLQSRKRVNLVPEDEESDRPEERLADPSPGALEQTLDRERRTKLHEALEELP